MQRPTRLHCPRCGSDQLRGGKVGVGGACLLDYWCSVCHLAEEMRDDEPGYAAWRDRWESHNPDYVYRPARPRPRRVLYPGCLRPAAGTIERDLGDVVWAPDDDRARIRYADRIAAADPERAEFIRLQLARFRSERERRALVGTPSAREQELIAARGRQWAGEVVRYARPDGQFPGYGFERGFVAHLRTDAVAVAHPADDLFRLAPIEHLDLTPGGPVRDAFSAGFLRLLRSLDAAGSGLTDDDVMTLAHDGWLDRCEYLDLRNNVITEAGVQALAGSEQIRGVPMVLLDGNPGWTASTRSAVEDRYGRIDWLHLAPTARPDRFHAPSARYP